MDSTFELKSETVNRGKMGPDLPASLELHPIFTDHMIFAAHKPIRFFGEGNGKIFVTWNGETREACCQDGHWFLEFPPMNYGGPYQAVITAENTEICIHDIQVGAVYLISGQSNMEFKLQESNESVEAYEGNPMIRMYSNRRAMEGEYFFPEDGWVSLTRDNAGYWSAIGYYMARKIQKTLSEQLKQECAVGLVTAYQGASVIESWMPENWLLEKNIFADPQELALFLDPSARHGDRTHPIYGKFNHEADLYHLTIEKTVPFSLNGVAWYQGESNTERRESRIYRKKLEAMIDCWREKFMDPSLGFVIIQIADFLERMGDEGWIGVQKAQEEIQQTRNHVQTVISRDICESEFIHPPTKNLLGERVAQAFLKLN